MNERDTLAQFLDQHREWTLAALDGLTEADAAARLLPATTMTIGGIVKHLAHMEDLWFTHKLLGEPYPEPWASAPPGEQWAWSSAADDSVDELRTLYTEACARSRAAVARIDDLDTRAALPSFGKAPVSLRWLWTQMIRETAQHRGHLDLMLDVIRARSTEKPSSG
ncbi:DinB family protein [Actinoplanes sp. NPDC048796]|uniref:DinB family protein n=1 Tax=Actinoplanes sp. NPDC048796 TaxID=3155640 RepID=UPI0033F45F5F